MGNWRKSSLSDANGGDCVEVGEGTGTVLVRDTAQAPLGDKRTTVTFTPRAWTRYTRELRDTP